jgi:gliding motility-associated-like protein
LNNYTGNIFKWQYKTTSSNVWIDSLITLSTIAFNNIQDTISVRAIVTSLSSNCSLFDTSHNIATINVSPLTVAGVLLNDTSVCSTANNGILHLKNYVGNIINWQSSIDNGISWNIINNSTDSLIYNNLAVTTKYRVLVQSGVCNSLLSNAVTITVAQPVTVANAGFDRLICLTDTIHLNANSSLIGTGVWNQISGNSVLINDANNPSTFVSGIAAGNYSFVWKISNNVCLSSSDTINVVLRSSITKADAGNDTTICNFNGTVTSINLHANIDATRNFETGTWRIISQPLTSNTSFSNINSPSSSFNFNKSGVYQLEWSITNDNNCSPSKDTIQINVFDLPVAGNITPSTTSACAGNNVNFTLNNYTGNIFKWQYKTTSSNVWIDSLITLSTIAFNNIQDTISVRAIVTSLSSNCSLFDTSHNIATINVSPLTVAGVLLNDTSVCSTANNGILHLKNYVGNIINWQSSIDNGISWNIINNSTDSLIYNNLAVTTKYRVLVQSGVCNSLLSNAVTITVAQPVTVANAGFDRLICLQDSIHLNANVAIVGNGVWNQISGNTVAINDVNNSSTFVAGIIAGNYSFVWKISNNVCSSSSDTINVVVRPSIINEIDTAAITVCNGQTTIVMNKTISGGNGNYTYQWQQSVDGINWIDIAHADSINNSFIPSSNIYVRRNVISAPCFSSSNSIFIQVQSSIANNIIGENQMVCKSVASDSLTGSLPTGGNGIYTYQWQKSIDSTSWNNINNANNKNYNAGIIQQKTFYRRMVTSGYCKGNEQNTSKAVSIGLNPNATAAFSITKLQGCEPFNLDSNIIKTTVSANNKNYTWLLNDSIISTQTYFPAISLGSYYNNISIKLITGSTFNCKADTALHNITVLHKATPSFYVSDTVGCGPLTVNLTNTTSNANAYSYQWNFGNGTTSTQINPSPVIYNYSVSGHDTTYTITLKAFNICDTVLFSKRITVKRKAKLDFTAIPLTSCSPLLVNFKNNSVGDSVQYKILFGDGTDSVIQSPSTFQHIYHSGNIASINAVLIAKNSCGIDSVTRLISILPNPSIINIITDSGVCGKQIIIINKTKNANSFNWNFGDGSSLTTTSSVDTIKHSYTSFGNYTISVAIHNNCSDTVVYRNVELYKQPKTSFITSNNICVGDSVSLINKTDTATKYVWSFGDGNLSSQINPIHFYNAAGKYIVSLQSLIQYNYATCYDSTKLPINIIAQKQGYMQVSDTLGNCLPFTVTCINKDNSLANTRWIFGDGSIATGDTVKHSFTSNGNFTIKMIAASAGGCRFVDSANIRIASPTGNVQTHVGFSCINTPIAFNATINNTDSLKWNFGDGNSSTTSFNNIQHSYTKAGIYFVQAQLLNKYGCVYILPITDTIKIDATKADFNLQAEYECGKTIYSLDDSSNAYFGINNLKWMVNNVYAGNTKKPQLTYTTDGNQNITLFATSKGGCIDSAKANINVFVHQFPKASINGIADACKAALLNFQSTVISRDSVFYRLWDLGNGISSKDTLIQVTYFSAGNYSVKLTVGTVNKCYDSAFKVLSVHPEPIVSLTKPPYICKGDSMNIIANGADNFIWKDANNNVICNNCNAINIKPGANTQYSVIGYNQYGCSNVINTAINVVQPFALLASANDSICLGKEVQLFAGGAKSYTWYPATGLNNTTGSSIIAKPVVTTTYHVIAKDAYNCFTDTANITIKVGNATKLNIGRDTIILSGDLYSFKPITSRNDIVKWNWQGANFNCYSCATPQAKIIYDQCISCTATNSFGCVSTDTICIQTFCPNAEIFVPNAFSPDGDGINDKLMIQGKGIKLVKSFRIFNRWGEVVFERTNFNVGDPAFAWDGKVRGKAATPDVYVYVCEVICEKGFPYIFKGNTTILK